MVCAGLASDRSIVPSQDDDGHKGKTAMQATLRRLVPLVPLTLLLGVLAPTFGDNLSKAVARTDAYGKDRHKAFVERAKQGDIDLLFLGDSLTEGWEHNGKAVWKERFDTQKTAAFGISGDRVENLLWRVGD